MREGAIGSKYLSREPVYDLKKENDKLNQRIAKAKSKNFERNEKKSFNKIKWCTKCTYPSISAAPMEFNSEGYALDVKWLK